MMVTVGQTIGNVLALTFGWTPVAFDLSPAGYRGTSTLAHCSSASLLLYTFSWSALMKLPA
jgi:hypothetical protein